VDSRGLWQQANVTASSHTFLFTVIQLAVVITLVTNVTVIFVIIVTVVTTLCDT
jgi:hypothetical protein